MLWTGLLAAGKSLLAAGGPLLGAGAVLPGPGLALRALRRPIQVPGRTGAWVAGTVDGASAANEPPAPPDHKNIRFIAQLALRPRHQGVAAGPVGSNPIAPHMKKQEETAHYHMSQGDLILLCHTKADFMDRDADAFASRGVKPPRVAAFRQQADAAAQLPSDEQLDYAKQALTDAVRAQRTVVESGMATLMSQVAIVHDSRSPAYKAFGSAGLYDDSEGDFYVNMGHLLDWATAHAAEYEAQGVTGEQLTALDAENEKYLAALKKQRKAISDRAASTQTRQKALNALYDELAALCGIGQGLFKQTDVSKYHDYVIDPAEEAATGI
jgi:hypothetical protein